jgi:hypothetical protein
MTLRIATNVDLPTDVATEAIAILARRGRGKTYTAAVLAEEMYAAGQPFVVLDPTGAWWGLRASADGKKPGLPVTIIGGEHGDVPLESTAGKLLATFVVENPGAYVLDLNSLESNAAQDRFVTAFAERLYQAKASDRRPLTLIVDEADSFAPQRPLPGQQAMLGAFESIVRRGRIRGLGVVLITQRPAVLNKNVLTQAGLLILLGITSPQDRAAIDDWVKGHAEPEQRQEVLSSLARLDVGEGWLWWPTEDVLERATIRQRRTFDSSSTPKTGEASEPVAFAKVDLDALKESIADTIEKAKADDPALLKARIRELEAELRKRPTEKVVETVTERVEVPVLDDALAERLTAEFATVRTALEDRRALIEAIERFGAVADRRPDLPRARATGRGAGGSARAEAAQRPDPPRRRESGRSAAPRTEVAEGDVKLGKGERTVLSVLAQWPDGRTYNELAFLAGYSAKASTLGVILSNLRKAGFVQPGNNPVLLTDEGLAAAGGAQPLPTGQALLDHWLRHPRMGEGGRKVLLALIDQYPEDISHTELCELTDYSPAASTMGVILSKLRKLGLVEKGARRVAAEFMESIQ